MTAPPLPTSPRPGLAEDLSAAPVTTDHASPTTAVPHPTRTTAAASAATTLLAPARPQAPAVQDTALTRTAGLPDLRLPATDAATPWSAIHSMPSRPDEFSFVLLSDRTALARPGVFEHAVEVTNLLRPDFAIHVGDAIEGYTEDPVELAVQWAEFDAITASLEVPLFRVPGNHDVSNAVMRDEWQRRHGMLHYHFVYRDVLFVVMDTQDPPGERERLDHAPPPPTDEENLRLRHLAVHDPDAATAIMEAKADWNGPMPVAISAEQLAWMETVVRDHDDVRWTIVCMHMPFWQNEDDPALARLRAAFGVRPYTMFAGHVHNYRRTVIDGRDHIRLGPTGGLRVLSGDDGNFDHVTWVTMTPTRPRIANVMLDGVLGAEGGTYRHRRQVAAIPVPA